MKFKRVNTWFCTWAQEELMIGALSFDYKFSNVKCDMAALTANVSLKPHHARRTSVKILDSEFSGGRDSIELVHCHMSRI